MTSPVPPPDLRERVMAAARAEPMPPRAQGVQRRVVAVAAGLAVSVAMLYSIGGPGFYGRPAGYTTMLAALWAGVALAACWVGVTRGRSMLGRPASWRIGAAVLTPVALLATAVLAGLLFPATLSMPTSFDDESGCGTFALLMGLGPLVAFAYARRGSDPVSPRLTAASIGAAAGALGALGVELRCSHASLVHVARAHLLPPVLITILAVVVAARFVGVRPAKRA